MPILADGLTWKDHLLPIMTECAAVMNYLHQARYYKEEDKEYKECIIHRDLKPENMLLTRNFSLRLAGEVVDCEEGRGELGMRY